MVEHSMRLNRMSDTGILLMTDLGHIYTTIVGPLTLMAVSHRYPWNKRLGPWPIPLHAI